MPAETISFEMGTAPLYAQLARILRSQIISGEYKSGDMLPPEGELSKTFGVSRITVRAALRILSDEGLIVRYSGRGTFVAGSSSPGAFWAACSIMDLIHSGPETRRELLARRVLHASRGLAERLQAPIGARIIEIQRLAYVDESPFVYSTLTTPYAVGRQVSAESLGNDTLIFRLLETLKLTLSHVDQWTTASLADARIAGILRISPGDPILVVELIFYDAEGRPVELAVNRFRSQFRHHIRLKGQARAPAQPRSPGDPQSGLRKSGA